MSQTVLALVWTFVFQLSVGQLGWALPAEIRSTRLRQNPVCIAGNTNYLSDEVESQGLHGIYLGRNRPPDICLGIFPAARDKWQALYLQRKPELDYLKLRDESVTTDIAPNDSAAPQGVGLQGLYHSLSSPMGESDMQDLKYFGGTEIEHARRTGNQRHFAN
ncbi:hypothetical protein V1522DRAFT_395319 [Lipomyces starkeyi]